MRLNGSGLESAINEKSNKGGSPDKCLVGWGMPDIWFTHDALGY